VPPRRSLCVIYSTCLPPYNVVRPGASCHCDRCFCHSPYTVPAACISAFIRLKRLLHLPLRPYACARCMFAYASRMRCMQPVYRRSFRTMTFGAYRAFQAWARSTRAVRNHFFLLMHFDEESAAINLPPKTFAECTIQRCRPNERL
jgi:hypothetical protein